MSRPLDADLAAVRASLSEMGSLCARMVHRAMRLLIDGDTTLLTAVRADEERVNALHISIDAVCLDILALRQPEAADLRFVAGAIKANSDLERVADQAVNMAETGLVLARLPAMPLGEEARMAELAAGMLEDALDSFLRADVALARAVMGRDDEVDRLKRLSIERLLSLMQSDPGAVKAGMDHILVSRNLERVADHATNIAEHAIFLALGRDVRHRAEALSV